MHLEIYKKGQQIFKNDLIIINIHLQLDEWWIKKKNPQLYNLCKTLKEKKELSLVEST